MPLAFLLSVFASLTPAQWISLLGLVPQFVKLAEDATPVIKQAVALVEKAVQEIEGLKANGVSHADAVAHVSKTTPGFAIPGWNDEETQRWLDRSTPQPTFG